MMLSFVLAAREMRSGIKGFRIFLACLALGVAALAAAGSTGEAFRQGLASQGRTILGGDVSIEVEGRRFTAEEMTAFRHLGRVSDRLHVRAMAENPAAEGDRRLVEVSGIDDSYPLVGTVELEGAATLQDAVRPTGGLPGIAVAPELLTRLHLKRGDILTIGDTAFRIRAVVVKAPDTLGRGFPLGPRVVVAGDVLATSGILQNDSLYGEAVTLAAPASRGAAAAALKSAFPHSGFQIKDARNALSGLGRLVDQLQFFLSFIALASLVTGGLGVASAVEAYLGERRPAIAVLKAMGADGALVRNIYVCQLGVLTALGVFIGTVIGAAAPLILGGLAKDRLPIPALFALYPRPLITAAAFGVLIALVFCLGPLARARATSPASLFRRGLASRMPLGWELVVLLVATGALLALFALTAPSPVTAAVMLAGLVVGFGGLWAAGRGLVAVAFLVRRFSHGAARIGLANLSGPRSAARTAAPALGFGIALLTAIVLIQSSLLAQVRTAAGRSAPSVIFTQIAPEDAQTFDAVAATAMGPLSPDRYRRYPFATGRISAIKGAPVVLGKIAPAVRWAFDQDLTLSAMDTAPVGTTLATGRWWPASYHGPPLAVIDDDLAQGAGLKVGDKVTVSLLGRDLDVTIAGTRKIDFGRFGANFPIILDSDAVAGANLREIAIARASKAEEAAMTERIGRAFPGVNIISVREQLDAAADIFAQIGLAIRCAAGVCGVSSLLVLIGAMAANAQARSREASVLKVLGSTRAFVIATYGFEYGAVGLVSGLLGMALGVATAIPVVTFGMHAPFTPDWLAVGLSLVIVVAIGTGLGALAAVLALSKRPAMALRAE